MKKAPQQRRDSAGASQDEAQKARDDAAEAAPQGGAEHELSPDRVAEMVAAGAQLIDVRRPYEWDGGRLAGARNIEMNELSGAADTIERERAVIFYCRGGNRSAMAADAFRGAGYDAYHVAGGLQAWADQGLPLEPEDGVVRAPPPAS